MSASGAYLQTLDQAATAQAQQRDKTATRALIAVPIKTSSGKCLFVDPLTGDFRANLIPIQIKDCDGSPGQQWDFITAGKHNNQPGFALIVSTQINGCLNFDNLRAGGNKVLLFSCGGRADGDGQTTDSQLFQFSGNVTTGTRVLSPRNANSQKCFMPKGNLLDSPDATRTF
ncbi:hypothetical protein CPB86DRAFT_872768 [Serendipita vermifera]|nr:hypothetical protein CPB86DRAFT_872768 [Serendipita vermifera]